MSVHRACVGVEEEVESSGVVVVVVALCCVVVLVDGAEGKTRLYNLDFRSRSGGSGRGILGEASKGARYSHDVVF